jgi:hypothetical protein
MTSAQWKKQSAQNGLEASSRRNGRVAMLDIKGKEMYSTGCTESVTSRV